MKFDLVNVFTSAGRNSGNQLAVVYLDAKLSDSKMQEIARDFNFSETVFIDDLYDLRIFTAKKELPFAGHPSIGAAWCVSQITKHKNFALRAPLGILAIEASGEGAQLTFPGSPVIKKFEGDLNHVLKHCSVDPAQVHTDFVRVVNSGPEFIVMPLKSHSALKKAVSPVTTKDTLRCYFVFQEDSSTYHVRMFSPVSSVIEDAATGSAACALAGFLRDAMGEPSGKVKIYQGLEMGRPSEIYISWNKKEIFLKGSVSKWASGEI